MKPGTGVERQAGAVLVFALVVLVAAAVTIGGIAQFAATRALVGSTEWEEAAERINLGNSRAMARQALLSIVFSTNAPTGEIAATNTDLRCGFALSNSVANYWTNRPAPASSAKVVVNPFNPMERGGFYGTTIEGTLWNGSTSTTDVTNTNTLALIFQPWVFQVRTRNPVAAGFAFVRHPPTTPVLGEQLPAARLDFAAEGGRPENWMTNSYQSVAVPHLRGSENENGELSVFLPDLSNSGAVALATNTNTGTLTVTLASSTGNTNGILYHEVEATDTNGAAITNLTVVGDTTRLDPPVLLRIPASNTNLSTLVFTNNNIRRVYVIREGDGLENLFVRTHGSSWKHLGLTISLTNVFAGRVEFTHGNPLRIEGGIITDAQVVNLTTDIAPETDPAGLDAIGNVVMWLEDHRLPGAQ